MLIKDSIFHFVELVFVIVSLILVLYGYSVLEVTRNSVVSLVRHYIKHSFVGLSYRQNVC